MYPSTSDQTNCLCNCLLIQMLLFSNCYNLKEHFYDGESGSGYLAWRLKTIQRNSTSSEGRRSSQLTGGGPTARRDASFNPEVTLSEEQCKEAISFMKYSSDEAAIKNKMKMTFDYRRKMVLDEERSSHVLTEFPRFRDVRGLVMQHHTQK